MSVSLETLEKLKNQLKSVKDLGTPIKADLYTHLTEVFNRIMLHHPNDAYDKFEEISGLVKRTNFKIKDPEFDVQVNEKAAVITHEQALNAIQKYKNLLAEEPDLVEKTDRGLVKRENNCAIPNFLDNAEMFQWAGVGFGETMNFLIQKSLKRLAAASGASSLRLFGKIYGSEADYWVAQGVLSEQEESVASNSQEKRGQGTNSSVFWVTHKLINDWIQLPEAVPEHVQIARLMVRTLTGNLNATIDSSPPFPGKERHFLRAQLARIQHATEICPKGLYEIEVDDETNEQKQKFSEEFAFPSTDELRTPETWCHALPQILEAGRCTHAEIYPDNIEEEAREDYLNKLKEDDPEAERWRSLNDEGYKKLDQQDSWSSKISGDTQQYNRVGGEGTATYAVNVVRSLRWPGAVTVSKNGKFATIYVGDGQKRGDSCFNPTEPPEVLSDPNEGQEEPEPNGKDPVPVVEGEPNDDEQE